MEISVNQKKRRLAVLLPLLPNVGAALAADPVPVPDPASPGASILGLAVPLLAVAFALAALWWILRRNSGRSGAAGPARIVQVLAVGPRERVVIVDHDTRRFMLGVTPSAVNVLADLGGKDAAKIRPSATSAEDRTFD
jgi:flagellar protein FliO/FliZ